MINKKLQIALNEILKTIPKRSPFSFKQVIKDFDPYSLKVNRSLAIELDLYKRVGLLGKIKEFLFEEGFVINLEGNQFKLDEKGIKLKECGSLNSFFMKEKINSVLQKVERVIKLIVRFR